MSALWIALAAALVLLLALAAAAWLAWRRSDGEGRKLVRRIVRLPLGAKARLALALAGERRIPLAVRLVPPALILYLATPIDLVPDFIPVLGHLDDVLVLALGVGLLLRFTPRHVLEEHLARLETA